MISEFQFGHWLPDQADMKNPGLEVCVNAIPVAGGYKPASGAMGTGATVTGKILGTASFERSDGEPVTLAATVLDIFIIANGTVTASGLGLGLADADRVSFDQFNREIYASSKSGATWRLVDIETSTAFVVANPPAANAMGRVSDFLVFGDLIESDTTDQPYRLRWSQFNNPNGTYGTDIATQSGAKDMDAEFGRITAISGGDFGLIFQRLGISRLTYTGGSSVFSLERYESNLGCIAPGSVVRVGDVSYFLSHESFSQTDGASVQSISSGKVWDWFLNEINEGYIESVEGSADFRNRCVYWAFPSGDTSDLDKVLVYSWETNSWSLIEMPVEGLVQNRISSITLEQLSVTYPDLDSMPVSLDAPEFRAKDKTLSIFQDGELKNLNGPPLAASFGSGDMQPQPGHNTFIDTATPLIESSGGNPTMSIGYRTQFRDERQTTGARDMGPLGFCDIRADGRYFSVAVDIPAGELWSEAFGYQLKHQPSGEF